MGDHRVTVIGADDGGVLVIRVQGKTLAPISHEEARSLIDALCVWLGHTKPAESKWGALREWLWKASGELIDDHSVPIIIDEMDRLDREGA